MKNPVKITTTVRERQIMAQLDRAVDNLLLPVREFFNHRTPSNEFLHDRKIILNQYGDEIVLEIKASMPIKKQ